MQKYLQHEHYALWEVIEFGDSYTAPENSPSITTTSTTSGKKSGRTVTLMTEDMHKKKNDVKARTTLLLSLPDEHQLRFSKHKTAKELWAAILKTFGGNEATKKTKKNLLKQQYGNFRAEGSETLVQTFTRLKANESSGNIATELIKPCTFGTDILHDSVDNVLPLMRKLTLLKSKLLIWRNVISHQC
nr:ribonuclease H-like domain-containing protein [Tanacetum cinerariifolium]